MNCKINNLKTNNQKKPVHKCYTVHGVDEEHSLSIWCSSLKGGDFAHDPILSLTFILLQLFLSSSKWQTIENNQCNQGL